MPCFSMITRVPLHAGGADQGDAGLLGEEGELRCGRGVRRRSRRSTDGFVPIAGRRAGGVDAGCRRDSLGAAVEYARQSAGGVAVGGGAEPDAVLGAAGPLGDVPAVPMPKVESLVEPLPPAGKGPLKLAHQSKVTL